MKRLQGRSWKVALLGLGLLAASAYAQTSGPVGAVPAKLPPRLLVGLYEKRGQTWMRDSGAPWDTRYCYLPKGWVNNFGWGAADGAFALDFLKESDAQGFLPAVTFYQLFGEPGGGESATLAKVQNATTMKGYFADFKLLMQRAKELGKPVLVLVEPDALGILQSQTSSNPAAQAAVASTGLPELAGLPDTVAGWGQAFLAMRKAAGADNVVLGMHVSAWASGKDIAYAQAADALQPEVDKVVAFLRPAGLGANTTGQTYDVLVGDPLDRDSDYYRLTYNQNRWWDASDTASLTSASFNRYAEWLRLLNAATGKRWVLWQIPLGNSQHLNVPNQGGPREGYKDNRTEYFFGAQGDAHRRKFANVGVLGLLFGAGADGQSTQVNDLGADGKPYLLSHASPFLLAGGLPLPTGTAPQPPPPSLSAPTTVSPANVSPGGAVSISTTVTNAGSTVSGAVVDLEVFNASGTRMALKSFTSQTLGQGQSVPYAWIWTSPTTTGAYTVKVSVYGPNRTPTYLRTDAAQVWVVAPGGDAAQYGFEDGTQKWAGTGGVLGTPASSNARAFAGLRSLAVPFTGTSGKALARVMAPPVTAGKTVTFRLWVPTGSKITGVQPYVLEGAAGGWRWTGAYRALSQLTAGAWNTVTLTVPATAGALDSLGVEFTTTGGWTGSAYVDSVRW